VEKIFKVDVLDVATMSMKGKMKRAAGGRHFSKSPDWKKAVVTIKPGQRVEFFEGA
jgi:large subunit ribosomal protein L23